MDIVTPFELFFSALETHGCKPKRFNNKVSAHCPAHDDSNPSLSLDVGDDGTALLYCHALCPTEEIVSLLDRDMSDLFPAKAPRLTGQHRAPAKKRAPSGPQDATWAVVPRCLPETMDTYCVTLYTYLDAVQGNGTRCPHGDQYIADVLGWTAGTVREHALHLAASGWVAIHKANTPSGAHKTTSYEVIHNPARKRFNPNATTPLRKVRAKPKPRGRDIADKKKGAVTRQTHDTPQSRGTVTRQTRDTITGRTRTPAEKVARSTREVRNNVGRETRDLLGTQIGTYEKSSSFYDDLDPEGDIADATEVMLNRAPLTSTPPIDDATLERLFAEDISEDIDSLFTT